MDEVLCIKKTLVYREKIPEDELWLDLDPLSRKERTTIKELVIPVYNHPHSDKENGQFEIHYHTNFRYIGDTHLSKFPLRVSVGRGDSLVFHKLPKVRDEHYAITPIELIKNSKLKHKCIYKGKCPHREYDLSQEKPDKNGVITCPLHGLKFDKNKKLINR